MYCRSSASQLFHTQHIMFMFFEDWRMCSCLNNCTDTIKKLWFSIWQELKIGELPLGSIGLSVGAQEEVFSSQRPKHIFLKLNYHLHSSPQLPNISVVTETRSFQFQLFTLFISFGCGIKTCRCSILLFAWRIHFVLERGDSLLLTLAGK